MAFYGDEYFTSQNMETNWKVILDSNINSIITFTQNDDNGNKLSTRKQALYRFCEFGTYGLLMHGIKKILSNPKINFDEIPFAIRVSILSISVMSTMSIQTCLIPAIFGIILGNKIKIKYSYEMPILSTNLRSFWKRWSVKIGDSLKNLIYKPLNGGIIGISALFTINMFDHYWLSYMVKQKTNYIRGWSMVFTTFGIGTFIDIHLSNYQKKQTKQNKLIPFVRYGLLITTVIIGMTFAYDTAFESATFINKFKK